VLMTIDENSYDPNLWSMGEDHPLVWAHEQGAGRVVYSAPGHLASSYADPRYQRLLHQAITWASRSTMSPFSEL